MKTLKILETMWFIIALISLSIGVYLVITQTLSASLGYFIISLLAFAFGFIRRKQRIKGQNDIPKQ